MIGLPLLFLTAFFPARGTDFFIALTQSPASESWLGGDEVDFAAFFVPEPTLIYFSVLGKNWQAAPPTLAPDPQLHALWQIYCSSHSSFQRSSLSLSS